MKKTNMIDCKECGKKLSPRADLCPKCGAGKYKKSRGVAIVLAIFLSFWTWLYTYKKDASKFWVALIFNLLLFWTFIVPILTWIFAIVNVLVKDDNFYEEY